MNHSEPLNQEPVFMLKGSMLAMTVLELARNDLRLLDEQLAARVVKAPKLFQNLPLVLELDKLPASEGLINLPTLLSICRKHGLRTIAIRTSQPHLMRSALQLDIPVLPPSNGRDRPMPGEAAQEPPAAPPPPPKVVEKAVYRSSKVITTPVRGGQQIYAAGTDLIVLNTVSPGAEILADGHIHVYGTMRGRALAGVKGDTQASIFCLQMEAELVSIAGIYKIAEDLRKEPEWGTNVHISLAGDMLNIRRL